MTTETMSAPAARHSLARSTVRSADRDQRNGADAAFPFADAPEPLRRERHRLEDGRIDRPQRDIVGFERQRALELRFIVRADAELEPGPADGGDVGVVEIALAEVDPWRAFVDRDAPVVVDDELRARLG